MVEDDLLFAQRARAAAGRLGVAAVPIERADAVHRLWQAGDVVVLQATLNPDRQLELVQQLRQRTPAPTVVAVTGHLETELRQRLKTLGATLAAHSAMDRVIARALRLNADAPRGRA